MKSLALFYCVLATGAALASAVTSDATFGVLKVASDNTETVISVPWVSATNLNTSVAVKDFVKTTGMTVDDELYLYANGSYKLWVYNGTTWEGSATVKKTGISATAGGDDTIARGQALIIVRAVTTPDIYLYGQYNSTGGTTYEMECSTSDAKSTLFAPINDTANGVFVNDGNHVTSGRYYLTWTDVKAGDTLTLQGANGQAVTLVWHDSKWGFYNRFSEPKGWQYDMQIQPGMGAWYRAVADADRDGTTVYPVATRNIKE